jgi:hypothetical protein
MYQWVIDVKRTVAGPTVNGRVTALIQQHMGATPRFVESVKLFVLRPIPDAALRESSGANFYLVSVSPRDDKGMYCLSVNPRDVGLNIQKSRVTINPNGDGYCFEALLLR